MATFSGDVQYSQVMGHLPTPVITTMKLKAIQLKSQQMNSLYTHQVHTAFQPAIRIKQQQPHGLALTSPLHRNDSRHAQEDHLACAHAKRLGGCENEQGGRS